MWMNWAWGPGIALGTYDALPERAPPTTATHGHGHVRGTGAARVWPGNAVSQSGWYRDAYASVGGMGEGPASMTCTSMRES